MFSSTGQIETKLCRNVTWVVNNISDFRFIGRINNADMPFVLWLDCYIVGIGATMEKKFQQDKLKDADGYKVTIPNTLYF
jgi:hypothetical protein